MVNSMDRWHKRLLVARIAGDKIMLHHRWEGQHDNRVYVCEHCKLELGWNEYRSPKSGACRDGVCPGTDADYTDSLDAIFAAMRRLPQELRGRLHDRILHHCSDEGSEFYMLHPDQFCDLLIDTVADSRLCRFGGRLPNIVIPRSPIRAAAVFCRSTPWVSLKPTADIYHPR